MTQKKTQKKLVVSDEIYIMLKNKQAELISQTGENIKMSDITNTALEFSINNIHLTFSENSSILVKEYVLSADTQTPKVEIMR